MICNCIHGCQNEADGTGPVPTMCTNCCIYNGLNDPEHQLPLMPAAESKLEPIEKIPDAQKDAAIQDYIARNGL